MKLSLFIVALLVGCGAQQLSAQQQSDIALVATQITVCQEEAHKCKVDAGDAAATCWLVYDTCMAVAGLTDGGAK